MKKIPPQPKRTQSPSRPPRPATADPREVILLAVTGMSPAILTETVWALAHEPEPIIPHRVVALTSTQGRAGIARELFSPSPDFGGRCVWDTLRSSLEKKGLDVSGRLRFGSTGDDIRIFTMQDAKTGQSRELDDIRTPQENAAVADFILEEVRRIVENPDTQLIASIAGGRKTMGALLYACLTVIGRQTDRLTHVLVKDPFDDPRLKPKFFYPGQPAAKLVTPDHCTLKSATAEIDLADVPFVPMRNLFAKEMRRMPGRFSALVERCRDRVQQMAAEDIHLEIRLSQPEIRVNGEPMRLSPAEYLILRFLADHAKHKHPAIDGYSSAVDPLRILVQKVYDEHDRNDFSDWRFKALPEQNGLEDVNERWITKNLSSLRGKLKAAGPVPAGLIPFLPEKGRFSLDLSPGSIGSVP